MEKKRKIKLYVVICVLLAVIALLGNFQPMYDMLSGEAKYYYIPPAYSARYEIHTIEQLKKKADADEPATYTSISDVKSLKAAWGEPEEFVPEEWASYNNLAESALRYENVEFHGYSGAMSYYFDKNGELIFSDFCMESKDKTDETFNKLLDYYQDMRILKTRTGRFDIEDINNIDEILFSWAISVPGRGFNPLTDIYLNGLRQPKLSTMEKLDYITLYKNETEGTVRLVRSRFGIKPVEELPDLS